jgi:hypothetical protein
MEGPLPIHPFHSPLSFLTNYVDVRYGGKKIIFLIQVFNVGIDEQRVCFGVDIFHSNLKAIEASRFWNLNFRAKLLR